MTGAEFIKTGTVRANMRQYQAKEERAISLAARLLTEHSNAYLALSGGKDSVAAAYIVDSAAHSVNRSFRLWLHMSDASFPGTLETCQEVAARLDRPLDVSRSECSAFELLREKEQRRSFGKTGVFFDEVRRYAADKDLVFTGVRARESKRRSKAAQIHGTTFFSASMGNVTVCNPLLYFDIFDVAAAITKYDAPIHPIYSKMQIERDESSTGEPRFIRLGYVTSRDLLNKGTAVFLKYNYPELFNKAAAVFPEIRSFT